MANEILKTDDPFNVLRDQNNGGQSVTDWSGMQQEAVDTNTKWGALAATQDMTEQGRNGSMGQFQSATGGFRKPMGEFEALEADWLDQLKIAAGMMFTFDEQEQINLIKDTLPEANVHVNEAGHAVVQYKGETGFVNKPGASWRDFASVAGTLLAFTPAFRTAKYASTVAGKSALVGAANTMTDVALQGTVEMLEGAEGRGVDAEQALIAGLIGGGSIAAVDQVAKFVAPLIKARGVKKAAKTVEEIGVRMKKFERGGLNPKEAYSRAIRDSGFSSAEATELARKGGRGFKVDAAAEKRFDDKLFNRATKLIDSSPLLSNGLEVASKAIVPISTRIEKLAPRMAGGLRRMQHDVHQELIGTEKRVDSFLKGMQKLRKTSPDVHRELKKALLNGDPNSFEAKVASLEASIPGFKVGSEDMRMVLDEMGEYMVKVGGAKELLKDYFPRIVKDYRKLAEVLTGKEFGAITTKIQRAQEKVGRYGRELDAVEVSTIVNRELRRVSKGYKDASRSTQRRSLNSIQDDLVDHYLDPEESLQLYLNHSINKKHKQIFSTQFTKPNKFSQDDILVAQKLAPNDRKLQQQILKQRAAAGHKLVPIDQDTNSTIMDMTKRAIMDGEVLAKDEAELVRLMDAVLNAGQRAQAGAVTDIKNVFYMSTLGNPISALTQFGDVAISAVLNGFNNTTIAAANAVARRSKSIKVEKVGVALDRAAEEMSSTTRATARMLNWTLKRSGFQAVDRFGKRTFINAAHRKIQKQMKTGKGISNFRDKYKDSFTEEELHRTITSLSNGTVDDNVKFVLWNELSGAQPLTMLEMPEMYLRNPNGRIFYMLKTFTLKQLDIMRRTALDDIAAGRVGKGAAQLTRHNSALLAAGVSVDTIKDMIRGRETDISDKAFSQFYRNFGVSENMFKDIGEGKVTKALGRIVLPPVNVADDAFSDIAHMGQQFNSLKNVPIAGALMYNWFGGGLEEANERLEKRLKEDDE